MWSISPIALHKSDPECSVFFRQVETEIRGLSFWAIRYRNQATTSTLFLGRPPLEPFARAAATLAGDFAMPPLEPIRDAAQLADPNNPSNSAGR